MSWLRYITHAEVVRDPAVPVPQWGLTDHGQRRALAMLEQPWVASIERVICSDETKAMQTAAPLAARVGIELEVRHDTGETDRTATGYLPEDEYDVVSAAFFAHPDQQASGWESAANAQARVIAALADVLIDAEADVAVVGHGGVGTALYCHLTRQAIAQCHDQPFAGHYFSFDRLSGIVVHPWWPIDQPRESPGRGQQRN